MKNRSAEIAKVLGFEFVPARDGEPAYWIYPPDYAGLEAELPAMSIPDFHGLIDSAIERFGESYGGLPYTWRVKL